MTDEFTPAEITEDTDEVDGVPVNEPGPVEDGPEPMQAGIDQSDRVVVNGVEGHEGDVFSLTAEGTTNEGAPE